MNTTATHLASTTARWTATRVTIDWTEAADVDGLTLTGPRVWDKAADVLTMLLATYRGPGRGGRGYAKTGFTVHFASGDTYTGRIDLGDGSQGREGRHCLATHMGLFMDAVESGRMPYFPEAARESLAQFRATHQVG